MKSISKQQKSYTYYLSTVLELKLALALADTVHYNNILACCRGEILKRDPMKNPFGYSKKTFEWRMNYTQSQAAYIY